MLVKKKPGIVIFKPTHHLLLCGCKSLGSGRYFRKLLLRLRFTNRRHIFELQSSRHWNRSNRWRNHGRHLKGRLGGNKWERRD